MKLNNTDRITAGTQRVNRIELATQVVYRRPRTFTFRAKPYPEDGVFPYSQVEEDGLATSGRISRDWAIFVWEPYRGLWVTDVDYAGPLSVDRTGEVPVPRYDTWDISISAAQQQAFCTAIDRLPDGIDVVVVGNHAPENYGAAMVSRMKRCGGTDALLSWTARSSYILVGKTGVGPGNAHYEVLNNITLNGKSNCAEVTFTW